MLAKIRQIPHLEQYKRIPIYKEIYADFITPILALESLKQHNSRAFLFESVTQGHFSRWTFLGFKPSAEISCLEGEIFFKKESKITQIKEKPKDFIRKILKDYKSPKFQNFPSFSGGLVGYFAYDFIRYGESKLDFDYPLDCKDLDLMLFDTLIAFDNLRQKILLISSVFVENLEDSYKEAQIKIKELETLLYDKNLAPKETLALQSDFKPLFSKEEYCHKVREIQHYIKKGDIFQAVLSNPIYAKAKGSILDAYRHLRTLNPSPYMFYLCDKNTEIMGASPETLLKIEGNKALTFPIAGTRKISTNNANIERELLSDTKELAEHNMLVDLGRNDLGRFCALGSVRVKEYLKVQHFSHIMHITSAIEGDLCNNKDCLDALESILPAGTLSGAPKIRACEIINACEGQSRGIYGGAIGYIDFNGDMDMCIAIRFAYKNGETLRIQSGAGIVHDSKEELEYEECIHKATVILESLNMANGGLKGAYNDTFNR